MSKPKEGENTCDQCGMIDKSESLVWITAEGFTPKKGEILQPMAYKQYQALCEPCYIGLLVPQGKNKKVCLYCENLTTSNPHFESQCCGRGMCDDCYNSDVGTIEQIQLDFFDETETIKPEYQNATYLCFECAKIWQVKK